MIFVLLNPYRTRIALDMREKDSLLKGGLLNIMQIQIISLSDAGLYIGRTRMIFLTIFEE